MIRFVSALRAHAVPLVIAPLLLGLLMAGFPTRPDLAHARSVALGGTNSPSDYDSVHRAMRGLSAGDTLILTAGIFDWSRNVEDSTLVPGQPGGMPITVERLTILGRGALLRGARDADGHPVRPRQGTNAAFRNAPGVHGVTIDGLIFEAFENAIVLLQADSLPGLIPPDALADGAREWTMRNLLVRKGPFGISANGRHDGLRIEECRFEMELPPRAPHRAGLDQPRPAPEGSFAVSIRPFQPVYGGISRGVSILNNQVTGPERRNDSNMFGGLLVSAREGKVVGNSVRDYGLGLVIEGTGIEVRGNTLTANRIGIVCWTTSRRELSTDGIVVAENDVRSSSRQGSGFLSEFSGTGIFLSGVRRSRIENNRFAANVGSDIVLGALRGTRPSIGNTLTGNHGTVLMTTASQETNTVTGSTVRIVAPPEKPAAVDSTGPG